MRIRIAIILGFLLLIVGANAQQSDNAIFAKAFNRAGSTVGQMVSAAQGACNPNASIPCYIVIDPSLVSYATGTMPAKCAQCVWIDYRMGGSAPTTINVLAFPGATADVKIKACLAALPSGGTCDARGFGPGVQSLASTITIGAGQTLLCDIATEFQLSGSAMLSNPTFVINAGAHVDGVWVDMGNLTTNTFNSIVFFFGGFYTDGQTTGLSHFIITAGNQLTTGSGVGFVATSSTTSRAAFVSVSHGRIYYLNSGVFISTSNDGWVNSYTFNANGGTIDGNQFINCTYQNGTPSGTGVLMEGSQQIVHNYFTNFLIWDTTATPPFTITDTNADENFFFGRFDGTWTDSVNGNNFFNALTNIYKLSGILQAPVADIGTVAGTGTATYAWGTGAGTTAATSVSCNTGYACDSRTGLVLFTTSSAPAASGATVVTVTLGGVTRAAKANCSVKVAAATGVDAGPFETSASTTTALVVRNFGSALSASTSYYLQYSCNN
jgi:hypothetical protein